MAIKSEVKEKSVKYGAISGKFEKSKSTAGLFFIVKLSVDFAELLICYMSINLGRGDGRMS